jgi:hypothetical protein
MRVQIRTCDDWIAVYKDGERVWNTHSCRIQEGLEALGIPFEAEDFDDRLDDIGNMEDGSDPFPERLPGVEHFPLRGQGLEAHLSYEEDGQRIPYSQNQIREMLRTEEDPERCLAYTSFLEGKIGNY